MSAASLWILSGSATEEVVIEWKVVLRFRDPSITVGALVAFSFQFKSALEDAEK
jgi:hypothetical protein